MVSSLALVTGLSFVAAAQALSLSETQHIFSFGDSYTADNYSVEVSIDPQGPEQFLSTTSGGYNWLQFLANTTSAAGDYYDLAVQGATVDNAIVDQGSIPSFKDQVTTFTTFFGDNSSVQWDPATTLFTIFFWINDVGYSYDTPSTFTDRLPYVLASYDSSLSRLYEAGARHFLFLGVPPTYRVPLIRQYNGGAYVGLFESNVNLANAAVSEYLDNSFGLKYPLATERRYDTTPLFNSVLDTPALYNISYVDDSCSAYEDVTNEPLIFDPSCVYPLEQFAWWNKYHPSWTVHRALALDIEQFLAPSGLKKRERHFGKNVHA